MDTGAWRATDPWGCKESDKTAHMRMHTHTCTHTIKLKRHLFQQSLFVQEISNTLNASYRKQRGGSGGKQCGRPRFNPVGKIFWRRKWQPTPVLLPGKSQGQRSVVGYSQWDHKESDTTKRLHFTSLQRK